MKIKLRIPIKGLDWRFAFRYERELRIIFTILPVIVGALTTGVMVFTGRSLFEVDTAFTIVFTTSIALLPLSYFEWRMDREIFYREMEIPVFLSALESSIVAGFPFTQAVKEASDHCKYLGKDLKRLVKRLELGDTFENAVNEIQGRTPLLTLLRFLIKILAGSGEEMYKEIGMFRNAISMVTTFKETIRKAASNSVFSLILVIGLYVFTSVVLINMFFKPLMSYITEKGASALITPAFVDIDTISAILVYGMLFVGVGSGIGFSYVTGGNYMKYLLVTTIICIISELVFFFAF